MDNVNCGYEESRREQARLQEELVEREKVFRDTRIRNIHEVEELKRAQEMRLDEFSRHELRECHATIQELTSQIKELQERKNCMNHSTEGCRINLEWKIIPRPQSTGNYSKSWWDAEPRPSLQSDTWNLLGTSGNIFDSLIFPIGIEVLQAEIQWENVQGTLSLEAKKEIERRSQPRDLQGNHQL